MDDLLTTLKVGIAAHLQKQGSSLEDFEKSLSTVNKADGAIKLASLLHGLSKEADWGWGDAIKGVGGGIGNALMAAPELAATTALIGGTTLGAGAYGLKKHFEGQDKALQSKEEEVQRIKTLTERLKSDYGLNHSK